jgi:phosphoribosylanthranilate isomerase
MASTSIRPRVKICGITNPADAELAIALGADALGFNAFSGSKRFIDLHAEADWIQKLPVFVTKVAVMVNPSGSEAEAVRRLPFIDVVQFHGHEEGAFCRDFGNGGAPFIKAIALRDGSSLVATEQFGTRHILLDAYSPGSFGGTGQLIDLRLAAEFVAGHPELSVTLSGGLTPANVAEAVRQVRPHAVDVASGVEMEGDPRRKDAARMREFIHAARS